MITWLLLIRFLLRGVSSCPIWFLWLVSYKSVRHLVCSVSLLLVLVASLWSSPPSSPIPVQTRLCFLGLLSGCDLRTFLANFLGLPLCSFIQQIGLECRPREAPLDTRQSSPFPRGVWIPSNPFLGWLPHLPLFGLSLCRGNTFSSCSFTQDA